MSRIGKKPIEIPTGVEVKISEEEIRVKGPLGELSENIHPLIKVEQKDSQIILTPQDENDGKQKALWGLMGSLISNMVIGVTEGFSKKLEIVGVGYKAEAKGKDIIILNLGFSHPIEFKLPEGITAEVEKNSIVIKGADKQSVGQVAANIRKFRKPEPYKGKGIKYEGEIIRRKAGKAAKASE